MVILAVLQGLTLPVSNASSQSLQPFTVLVSDNGVDESSGPSGHPLLVRVFLLDSKNVGGLGIDKTVAVSFIPNDATQVPIKQNLVIRGGATMTSGGVSGLAFYGSTTIIPTGAGILSVDYTEDADYPTQHYSRPIDIWVPQARATVDQKDQLSGYQVHAIYVVPKDGIDNKRDTRGEISTWLIQGARWLDTQAGDHWQYDTYNNIADVTFFHSSYNTATLSNTSNDGAGLLTREMGSRLPLGSNRKTYLFFIETNSLIIHSTDPDYSDGKLCGISHQTMSHSAIIATGNAPVSTYCTGYNDTMDWQAATAVHEVIHTFGVAHVTTPTDLMLKIPGNDSNLLLTLDAPHTQYFGGALAGRDIQKLPIWSKDPMGKLYWPCYYDFSVESYYCKTNNPDVIDAYKANCWSRPNSTLILQVKSGSKWVTAPKSLKFNVNPVTGSGCVAKYPTSYLLSLSSAKTGVFTYRFIAKGWTGRTFNVIYQN